MIKSLVLAAAILLPLPALAGSITVSATTVAGGTLSQSVTVSDANVGRILAAYKLIYGQVCDTASPPVCRDQTNAEAFANIAQTLFAKLRADVQQQERASAGNAVVPVPMQ